MAGIEENFVIEINFLNFLKHYMKFKTTLYSKNSVHFCQWVFHLTKIYKIHLAKMYLAYQASYHCEWGCVSVMHGQHDAMMSMI